MIFLISQRHVKEPILNLSIFSNRNVSAATAVNLLVGFCIMVALVSVPIFINVAGSAEDTNQAALVTGYLLCAFTVPMALAAIPGGWLSSRFGYRWSVIFGLVIAVVGFLMMSFWKAEMARQAVALFAGSGAPERADLLETGFMAAGLAFGGNRHRIDHRADRDGSRQCGPGSGAGDGFIAGHHRPPHRHEHQHELDDCIWAAAHDHPRQRDVET